MYSIRFHGRGGHGIKTASRVLGTALFLEGFEVQDSPRYGAERRGAPLCCSVRADHAPILERGIIRHPDLVIVADDTLLPIPAAAVLAGIKPFTVLLVRTSLSADTWRNRLGLHSPILTLPQTDDVVDSSELPRVGLVCAGAAAGLLGVISAENLTRAVRTELEGLPDGIVRRNAERALDAFEKFRDHAGCITEGSECSPLDYKTPDWIDPPFDEARVSAPVIHGALTSVEVKTGLWRTLRPVVDHEACHRCVWVCGSFCPDSAIRVDKEGYPQIDYDHCKGCMICLAQCPSHAIHAIPESEAGAADQGGNSA